MGYLKEEWKPIPGYTRFYEVSNHGRVRSLARTVPFYSNRAHEVRAKRVAERILKPGTSTGYANVTLCKGDDQTIVGVHRLVARVFIGKPPKDKPVVMHKDDNGLNNRVDNLSYGSTKDNADDMVAKKRDNPRRGASHGMAKLTASKAKRIYRLAHAGVKQRDLASQFNIDASVISEIKNGHLWSSVTGHTR